MSDTSSGSTSSNVTRRPASLVEVALTAPPPPSLSSSSSTLHLNPASLPPSPRELSPQPSLLPSSPSPSSSPSNSGPPTLPPPDPPLSAPTLLILGGLAGCASKTLIAPLDNIKILYQLNPQSHFSIPHAWNTARDVVKDHGPQGLWRGNAATLMRVFPYASIVYCTHDFYFHRLRHSYETSLALSSGNRSSSIPALSSIEIEGMARFIAGGLAGTTATLLTYPLDVFRARLAASIHNNTSNNTTYSNNMYNTATYIGTIRTIYNNLGIRGLFSGLSVALLGIFPYSGISFGTYHTLKRLYLDKYPHDLHDPNDKEASQNKLPVMAHLTCGAIAALMGQSITYPLDVIRRRRQVGVMSQQSLISAFKSIYNNEGLYGFYRGLSMNWIKGPIAVAVSFVVNDRMKHIAQAQKKHYSYL